MMPYICHTAGHKRINSTEPKVLRGMWQVILGVAGPSNPSESDFPPLHTATSRPCDSVTTLTK